MTLILGIEDGDKAYVFGDRAVFRSGGYVAKMVQPKIWASNGWVIGGCGDHDFLCAAQRIAAPDTDEIEPWIDTIYSKFSEMSAKFKGAEHKEEPSAPGFIAARGGMVYLVEGMCVLRTHFGYGAVGAPWQYATGACEALRDEPGAIVRGLRTMRVAYAMSDGMGPPFDWMCTDGSAGTVFD